MAPRDGPAFFGPLLIATDFERTVRFYRDVIGLPLQGNAPYAECTSERSVFSVLDARFWTHVNDTESPLGQREVSGETVLVIQVPDVDAAFERLMAAEVKFLSPPTDRPPMGIRNAFLRDPDRRVVALTSPLRRATR